MGRNSSSVLVIKRGNDLPDPLDDYGQRKAQLKTNGNGVMTRPIGRLDKDIASGKGKKRVTKYTPVRMVNAINKYFEWCERNDEVPTIKGMMLHLKLYPTTFYKLIEDVRFQDILETARMHIANWAEIDVYNTPGQAAGKIAFMKNIHGWTDKLKTENSTEVKQIMTTEQATAKISELAPLLLSVLNNQRVVEQLGHKVEEAEIVEAKNG